MLKRGFVVLCVSIFIAAIGAGMIAPILPLYAKDLGASGFLLGIIFSGFFISMAICNPFIGRLSDRIGEKILITSGFGFGSLIVLMYVWASNPTELIIIRFLHGIAIAMILPVIMAYIGELCPIGQEGSYMGVYSMMLFLGMSTGPIVGGIIVDARGMHFAFYSFTVTLFIAFIATLFLLPSRPKVSVSNISKYPIKDILSSAPLKGLFVFNFTLAIAQSGLLVFLPLLARDKELSITEIGILASSFIFFGGILQAPFGWIANRYNRVKLVISGTIIIAIGLACLPLATGFYTLLILGGMLGAAAALASPAANALTVEHSREIGMGVVMGFLNMFTNLGMILGPVAAGIVMDQINLSFAFYLYSLLFFIGASFFYYFMKDLQNSRQQRVDVGL
jgi:MFS family permease